MSLQFSPEDIYANTVPYPPAPYQRILEDDDKSDTEYPSGKAHRKQNSKKDALKAEDDSEELQTPPTSEPEEDRDLDEAADSDSDEAWVGRTPARGGSGVAPHRYVEGEDGSVAPTIFLLPRRARRLGSLGPLGDESEDSDEGDVDEEDRRSVSSDWDDYDVEMDES
ncbi:hypothetical protein FA95DRAFT_1618700 [Auriscalpium vulgare]|uniref:Uncharacterized protein n=1 Tax=Auriscalpium vulgare TaxID=40419 RepID=A0ACB8S716_9AGAM|nr:hypothetical protein FA95DRAFT_1618700 [Auriscalpium vulgare]